MHSFKVSNKLNVQKKKVNKKIEKGAWKMTFDQKTIIIKLLFFASQALY